MQNWWLNSVLKPYLYLLHTRKKPKHVLNAKYAKRARLKEKRMIGIILKTIKIKAFKAPSQTKL